MNAWDVLAVVLSAAAIGWFIWFVGRPGRDRARRDEEAARAFFDRHGHWPDQDPSEAILLPDGDADADRDGAATPPAPPGAGRSAPTPP